MQVIYNLKGEKEKIISNVFLVRYSKKIVILDLADFTDIILPIEKLNRLEIVE